MVHQGYSSQGSWVNQRLIVRERRAQQREPSFSTRGLCRRRIRNRQTSRDPCNRRNTNGRTAGCFSCHQAKDGYGCPNQFICDRTRTFRSKVSVLLPLEISGKQLGFRQIGLRFGSPVEYPLSWLICLLQEALGGTDRPVLKFAGV
jgi:hypothetical protein